MVKAQLPDKKTCQVQAGVSGLTFCGNQIFKKPN
jgi:hypothetical protein